MSVKILHNPRCSKSRQTLEIIREEGIEPMIVEYLKTPPNRDELIEILQKLSLSPRQLMRKGEAEYKENNLADDTLSDDQLIDAMVEFPKLIERPIVIHNGQVRIGRPPESVLEIL
ncbi:MAG: arsenate reductase (glutaredoxin) [Sneathiella sp.]